MGKVCSYDNIEFWAEGGVVYLVDKDRAEKIPAGVRYSDLDVSERNRVCKGLPPKEFLKRAYAAAVIEAKRCEGYPSEEAKVRKFIEDFRAVYRQAVEQGAIDDPKAAEFKIAHKNLNKKRLVLPVGAATQEFNFANKTSKEILLDGLS